MSTSAPHESAAAPRSPRSPPNRPRPTSSPPPEQAPPPRSRPTRAQTGVLLLDELGSDAAAPGPSHRSSSEAGANYGLTGTCDSSSASLRLAVIGAPAPSGSGRLAGRSRALLPG